MKKLLKEKNKKNYGRSGLNFLITYRTKTEEAEKKLMMMQTKFRTKI